MRDYTRNIHKTDPICSGHVWIDWTASNYEMMQFIYSDFKKRFESRISKNHLKKERACMDIKPKNHRNKIGMVLN